MKTMYPISQEINLIAFQREVLTYSSNLINELSKQKKSYIPKDELYLMPEDKKYLEKKIINLILSAKESIDIAMYNLKYKKFIDAILLANKNGVNIRVLLDDEKVENSPKVFNLLKQNGVNIKVSNKKMHMKVAIFDKKAYIFGSLNWKDEPFYKENYEHIKLSHNLYDIKKIVHFMDAFFNVN